MRIILATIVSVFMIVCGCSKDDSFTQYSGYICGEELYCNAETCEQAEEIASQYGIELVSFEFGIATFHTKEAPYDVIMRGKANGWAELSLNAEKQITG